MTLKNGTKSLKNVWCQHLILQIFCKYTESVTSKTR
jgi:hypothetical protein